jgi:uncharacterized membrane protein
MKSAVLLLIYIFAMSFGSIFLLGHFIPPVSLGWLVGCVSNIALQFGGLVWFERRQAKKDRAKQKTEAVKTRVVVEKKKAEPVVCNDYSDEDMAEVESYLNGVKKS